MLRLKDGAQPLDVPLNGASEFEIRVKDGGDGRAWDQALLADARVHLKDGDTVALQDLPVEGATKISKDQPPFSFRYGGQASSSLLKNWKFSHDTRQLDSQRTAHTLVYTDPATGLQVRCEVVEYADFPTVEWTIYFKNTGAADTPILEGIQALDTTFARGEAGDFLLHHAIGSPADGNDYGPLATPLKPGASKRIGAAGGRPTNSDWSYFNLETGEGEGLIMAVGWPGQWSSEFIRGDSRNLTIRAGQERTHFKLLPGEEVRGPLIVLQFWTSGDWIRAQNVWRRWMMAHSMPKPGGRLPEPQLLAASSRQYDEMIKADEANQTMFIDRYLEEDVKLDYWWMDAGWYVHHGGGWPRVGTWLVDSNRFPNGLRPISDHAHKNGMKTLLWFEPERVTPGTWLAENHPEWILGGAKGGLLNLGNDAARQWLIEHVDQLLTEQGIGLYRQDFNMDPLEYWRNNDTPDRQGITEIRHVTGYLAFWDELRRRHPDMLIDACASGGRRNDLETMRRSAPLWRSDYAYEAIGHQCMTYGISLWLPFHGTGTVAARNASYYGSGLTPVDPYAFWSNAAPSLGLFIDMRIKELDYPTLRRLVDQWRQISPNYYGDFYPLTSWNRDSSQWMAWQFDRPETGEGMVQVFRRDHSPFESARFRLRGLEADAEYTITHLDGSAPQKITGRELLEKGLSVSINEQPGVAVVTYQKQ
ncbi:MAG: hypothetical protein FGM15_11340 [Chthoniobacterales bacterium]|nr:hypothetical protein [Chthoniobacterales bacterium]